MQSLEIANKMTSTLKKKLQELTSDQSFSMILTGSAYSLAARIITAILNLIASVVIARFYGADALGVLAVITSIFSFVIIFSVMGTNTSILRLIPEHITTYSFTSAFKVFRKVQFLVATLSVILGVALFFLSDVLAEKILSKPYLSPLLMISSCFVLFKSLLDLNMEAIRGLKLIKIYAVMQAVPAFFLLIFLLAGLTTGASTNTPIYAQLAAWAVAAALAIGLANYGFKGRMKPGDNIRETTIKEITAISFPMLMTASMYFLIGQVSIVILGIFQTEADVGYYSVATRLATLTVFILGAINTMAAPRFSELFHAGKMEELFRVAKKSTKLIFWTTTPILIFLIVLGRPLLAFVFGAEYTAAYPAMVLLVLGQFVNSISGSTGYFMSMTGNQNAFMKIVLVSAAISVIGNLSLIPLFGSTGAALSSLLSIALLNIAILAFMKRKFNRTTFYTPFLSK